MTLEFAPVDPIVGTAGRQAVGQITWATITQAIQPLLSPLGITLPADPFPPPDGWTRLDIAVANAFTDFFTRVFQAGSAVWNASIAPAINQIVQSVGQIVPTEQAIVGAIVGAFTQGTTILDVIRQALTEALTTVSINVQAVTDTIINVIKSGLASALQTAFTDLSNAAASITKPILDVVNNIQDSTNYLYTWTNGVWKDVTTAIHNYALNASVWAEQAVRDLRAYVEPPIQEILQIVKTGLNIDLSSVLGDLPQQLATQLSTLTTTINTTINNILPTLSANINSVVDVALQNLTGALNTISGQTTQLIQSAFTQIGEIEQFIVTEFKYWVGEEGEYIINSLRGAQTGLGDIAARVDNVSMQIQDGVNYIVQTDQSFYQDLAGRIDNGWVSFSSQLQTTLAGGLSDIWGGFQNDVLGPAANAIGAFFGGIWDRLKGFFTPIGCEANVVADWFGGIFKTISDWIQSLCGGNCQNMGKDPFNIISRSLTGVLGVGGGLGLSLMAGELISPLKQLGMSRLAAYIWDMADFKTVGGDVLKSLNAASTIKPLMYGLNEFFRPELPRTDEANAWYHKGIINDEQWRKIYAQHGLANAYIDNFALDLYREPSDRVILNLLDTEGVPIEWVNQKLKAVGYSDADIAFLKIYATNRRLSDEFNAVKSAYEAAYIKGYVSLDEYTGILRAIGRNQTEVSYAVFAAEQKARTARLSEDIDILVQAYRTHKLTDDQFEQNINGLGLDPDKAQNIIEKELARKKAAAAADTAEKQRKLTQGQILDALDLDLMTEAQALERLQLLEFTPDDALLVLQLHAAELAAKEADQAQKALLDAQRAKAKEDQNLAIAYARWNIRLMQARLTSLDGVIDEIRALPLSDAWKNLLINEATIASQISDAKERPPNPPKLRETEIYKAWKYGYIDEAQVRDYLAALGFTADQIDLKVAINAPAVAAP